MQSPILQISPKDILERLEIDPSEINETSIPLSTVNLDSYAKQAEAHVMALLESSNLDPDTMNDAAWSQARSLAIIWCVRAALAKLGRRGNADYEAASDEYDTLYQQLSNRSTLWADRSPNRSINNIGQPNQRLRNAGRRGNFDW